MAEVVQLTLAGKKALEDKLEYLKNVRRAEITEEIAVARSFGDLSENAEYDAAKDAQAHNELEIMELEAMLKNVVIIDETHTDGKQSQWVRSFALSSLIWGLKMNLRLSVLPKRISTQNPRAFQTTPLSALRFWENRLTKSPM